MFFLRTDSIFVCSCWAVKQNINTQCNLQDIYNMSAPASRSWTWLYCSRCACLIQVNTKSLNIVVWLSLVRTIFISFISHQQQPSPQRGHYLIKERNIRPVKGHLARLGHDVRDGKVFFKHLFIYWEIVCLLHRPAVLCAYLDVRFRCLALIVELCKENKKPGVLKDFIFIVIYMTTLPSTNIVYTESCQVCTLYTPSCHVPFEGPVDQLPSTI